MPLASVQIERTDSLELLPVAKAETKRYGHPSYTYLQYIYRVSSKTVYTCL